MIDDLWTSLKAQLYERTTSPLLGTLAIAWVAWNHRLFVVLLAGDPFSDRFAYIDEVLYPDWKATVLFGAVLPLVTALVFLFVYPFPAKWVFQFWRKRQKELKEIRQRIEDETPLTVEESRRLRRQMIELRTEYENQLRQTSEEANQLREGLAEEQQEKESLREELEKLRHASRADQGADAVPSEDDDEAGSDRDIEGLFDRSIDHESLMEYARRRFPDVEPSDRVTKMLLKDLDPDRYQTIRDLDHAVTRARDAVQAYEGENPQVFKYGTDRLTKSLGFVDDDFRSRHGFSSETRSAFERHRDKVNGVE